MEWISVKDRLPEEETHVIGFCRTCFDKQLHVEPLLFQINERKHLWAHLFAYNEGYSYAIEVTHWMPLPSPPNQLDTNLKHNHTDTKLCQKETL